MKTNDEIGASMEPLRKPAAPQAVQATEQDAARYRWLRDDSRECMGNMGEIYVTQHALPNDEDSMDHDLFMDALDAAIDAALAAQAAKQGEQP